MMNLLFLPDTNSSVYLSISALCVVNLGCKKKLKMEEKKNNNNKKQEC